MAKTLWEKRRPILCEYQGRPYCDEELNQLCGDLIITLIEVPTATLKKTFEVHEKVYKEIEEARKRETAMSIRIADGMASMHETFLYDSRTAGKLEREISKLIVTIAILKRLITLSEVEEDA